MPAVTRNWKRQGTDPEGAQPFQQLDLGPVKLILDFWPPKYEKIIHLCFVKLPGVWQFAMAAIGN